MWVWFVACCSVHLLKHYISVSCMLQYNERWRVNIMKKLRIILGIIGQLESIIGLNPGNSRQKSIICQGLVVSPIDQYKLIALWKLITQHEEAVVVGGLLCIGDWLHRTTWEEAGQDYLLFLLCANIIITIPPRPNK